MKESRLGRPAEVIKRGVKSPEKIDVKVSFSILMEKAVKENKRIQKSSRAGYINCSWILDVIGHSPWGFSGPILQFLYWVRSDVSLYKAPQAARYQSISDLTHPIHTWGDRPPHRELRPLLFSTSAWVL